VAVHTYEVMGISEETLARLDERTHRKRVDRSAYICDLLDRGLCAPTITELLEPFRKQVRESSATDEELDQLFSGARAELARWSKCQSVQPIRLSGVLPRPAARPR
jgi:hypothetical protein